MSYHRIKSKAFTHSRTQMQHGKRISRFLETTIITGKDMFYSLFAKEVEYSRYQVTKTLSAFGLGIF